MSNDTYKPDELANYQFGDTTAPEGFDPDTTGAIDPTPGRHRFRIEAWSYEKPAYEVKVDHEFKWKGEVYVLNQLQVRFRIPKGQPEAGATIMAFLPMPTPSNPGFGGCAGLANQWGQFLKSLGFRVPEKLTVPDGFRLEHIDGRECLIDIEHRTDQDGTPRYRDNGRPDLGVALYGFHALDADPKAGGGTASKPNNNGQSRANKPAPKQQAPATPAGFDL